MGNIPNNKQRKNRTHQQNWNPQNPVTLDADSINQYKTIEIYLIPKQVKLPNGKTINMDSDTVKSIIGRTIYDRDSSHTSKFTPSTRSDTIEIIIPTFDMSAWQTQLPEELINKGIQYTTLAADKLILPEGKILMSYTYMTFADWDDSSVDHIYAKGFDNVLQSGFSYSALDDGQINVFIRPESGSNRIYEARVSCQLEESNGTIFASVIGSLANLQAPFAHLDFANNLVRPAGPLADYVWYPVKEDASELELHVMRIPYLFQIGTDYKNN